MVTALHLYKITLLSNTINNKTTFSFTPPQNHTALKPYRTCSCAACCFTSPQNYTTFKPIQDMADAPLSLCTHTKLHYSQTIATAVTQNDGLCTHTKLHYSQTQKRTPLPLHKALYPYKITLLSNNGFKYNSCVSALYPYKITLLSNNFGRRSASESCFVPLQNYTTLKPQISKKNGLRTICAIL